MLVQGLYNVLCVHSFCYACPGPVPRDQGVMKVLEYLANMVDYENCVRDALSYLLEVAKSEEGLLLDARYSSMQDKCVCRKHGGQRNVG